MTHRTCSVAGCTHPHLARDLCEPHYRRLRSTGDVKASQPLRPGPGVLTASERFWRKVNKTQGCWLWTAAKLQAGGYGNFRVSKGVNARAHVFAYRELVGEIPAGLVLDHTCHNPACVNPKHLRPVTRKQNNENHNGHARSDSQSGVRGVWWSARDQMWMAGVQRRIVGRFHNIHDAEAAAIEARNQAFTHNDLDRR